LISFGQPIFIVLSLSALLAVWGKGAAESVPMFSQMLGETAWVWQNFRRKFVYAGNFTVEQTLDATDRRILAALQKEGRITNAELSERVNLSPSACHRRVQRLEEEGFIAGYVALVDARRLGKPTTVFVEITLQSQAEDLLDAFEREVARIPDILECHLMAGTADYLLKIVAEDTEDFARIHRQRLSRLPGVRQMQSSFALREVLKTTALPV
jgi:Lrp/AsnC family leucine-responsive transcriptional regulator